MLITPPPGGALGGPNQGRVSERGGQSGLINMGKKMRGAHLEFGGKAGEVDHPWPI